MSAKVEVACSKKFHTISCEKVLSSSSSISSSWSKTSLSIVESKVGTVEPSASASDVSTGFAAVEACVQGKSGSGGMREMVSGAVREGLIAQAKS